jgi:hypothetical protein
MGRASRVRKLTRTAVLLVAKLGTESTSTCPASARQHHSLEQALTHCLAFLPTLLRGFASTWRDLTHAPPRECPGRPTNQRSYGRH